MVVQTLPTTVPLRSTWRNLFRRSAHNNKVIYQIDWDTDGDGDVDETEYVAYGETPSHEDGSKASTTDTVYTFTGWDPEIVTATGTATYTARFSSDTRTYTATVPTGEGYHPVFRWHGIAIQQQLHIHRGDWAGVL